MKHLLITIALSAIFVTIYAQNDCKITAEYDNIFSLKKIKVGEREVVNPTVNTIDSAACFADLVNDHEHYIGYLRQHFSARPDYNYLKTLNDSVELQRAFINALEADTAFNRIMEKQASKILHPSAFIPDTISFNKLMNIAVKYFSVTEITKDGYYAGKICTGINAIDNTESKRSPFIEAFCFSAIITNMGQGNYNLYDEFVAGIHDLYTLNLGVDIEERLLRSQGALFMFMKNNEVLQDVIRTQYELQKNHLPFVLREE
jgi:hypothetical protein